MAQHQKVPLRPLTPVERDTRQQIARAGSERADRAARAKALLAVADGARFTDAARAAGRRSGDGVAQLVARFNRAGVADRPRSEAPLPPLCMLLAWDNLAGHH
jgi:hypothetical protein